MHVEAFVPVVVGVDMSREGNGELGSVRKTRGYY